MAATANKCSIKTFLGNIKHRYLFVESQFTIIVPAVTIKMYCFYNRMMKVEKYLWNMKVLLCTVSSEHIWLLAITIMLNKRKNDDDLHYIKELHTKF